MKRLPFLLLTLTLVFSIFEIKADVWDFENDNSNNNGNTNSSETVPVESNNNTNNNQNNNENTAPSLWSEEQLETISELCGKIVENDIDASQCLFEYVMNNEDEPVTEEETEGANDLSAEAVDAELSEDGVLQDQPLIVDEIKEEIPMKEVPIVENPVEKAEAPMETVSEEILDNSNERDLVSAKKPKAPLKEVDIANTLVVERLRGGGCGVIKSHHGSWVGSALSLLLILPLILVGILRFGRILKVICLAGILLGISGGYGPDAYSYDFTKKYVNSYESRGFVESALLLKKGAFFISTQADYSADLLYAETVNKQIIPLIEQSVRNNVTFNAGISKYIQLGVTVPQAYQKYRLLEDKNYREKFGLSDVTLESKFLIVHKGGYSMSLTPEISYNRPADFNYFSSKRLQMGLKTALTRKYKRFQIDYNLGYRYMGTEYVYGMAFRDYMHTSLGMSYLFSRTGLSLFNGIDSQLQIADISRLSQASIPLEWNGMVGHEYRNIKTQAGLGAGLSQGYGTPSWRAFLGLSYRFEIKKKIRRAPRIAKKSKVRKVRSRKLYDVSTRKKRRNKAKAVTVKPEPQSSYSNSYLERHRMKQQLQKKYESGDVNFDGLD